MRVAVVYIIRSICVYQRQRKIIHLGRDTDMLLVKVLFSCAFGICKASISSSPSTPRTAYGVRRTAYCVPQTASPPLPRAV